MIEEKKVTPPKEVIKIVESIPDDDSEQEFDPEDLKNISRPPPSNFVWPPNKEEEIPTASPLYVQPPETHRVVVKPCTRVFEKPKPSNPSKLAPPQQTPDSLGDFECNESCKSACTVTSTTSEKSSESEYKVYQTQNNFNYQHKQSVCSAEVSQFTEHATFSCEIDENRPITPPPPPGLPKTKHVGFIEPDDAETATETYSGVFSNRRDTWQKLTSTQQVEVKREEKVVEIPLIKEEEEEEIDEFAEELNIRGQQAGPLEGVYHQLPPSNIPQPTPKQYKSEMHKALIVTSEKPFQMSKINRTFESSTPNLDLYEEAILNVKPEPEVPVRKEEIEIPIKKEPKKIRTDKYDIKMPADFPHYNPRKGGLLTSVLTTVSPTPMEFVKSNVIEKVPLPDESDAYFPPPISMQPNEPLESMDSYRSKSPFVKALITAPDRAYTPFGQEIMSQLSLELPKDLPKISFSNALNTAPDASFQSSSLQYEYEPVEQYAQYYEKHCADAQETDYYTTTSTTSSSAFAKVGTCMSQSVYLPKVQPWSRPSEQMPVNMYTDSMSAFESQQCSVSDSRRASEIQKEQVAEPEPEPEPEPQRQPIYPKRGEQPSPFEGMQIRVTNKLTSNLHKPDEIPTYQRKWYNLPTQNPTPSHEPEELRGNVPMAFIDTQISSEHVEKSVSTSVSDSRRSSKESQSKEREELKLQQQQFQMEQQYELEQMQKQLQHQYEKRKMALQQQQEMEQQQLIKQHQEYLLQQQYQETKSYTYTATTEQQQSSACFPTSAGSQRLKQSREEIEEDENEDTFEEQTAFPTRATVVTPSGFPMRKKKNSIAGLQEKRVEQFEKVKSLRNELHEKHQMFQEKQKKREQMELARLQESNPAEIEFDKEEIARKFKEQDERRWQQQLKKEEEKAKEEQKRREMQRMKEEQDRQIQMMKEEQREREEQRKKELQKIKEEQDRQAHAKREEEKRLKLQMIRQEEERQRQEQKRREEQEMLIRQKEQNLKEIQERMRLEEEKKKEEEEMRRLQDQKTRQKRERELREQQMREEEYRTFREKQDEEIRLKREAEELKLRQEQEEIEREIQRRQDEDRKRKEEAERKRIAEEKRREAEERELKRIEEELRQKREEELKKLEEEIRERREQQQREIREAEAKIRRDTKAKMEKEREERRLQELADKQEYQQDVRRQQEEKLRRKQEQDRREREKRQLFDLEEETRKMQQLESQYQQQEEQQAPKSLYASVVHQQQKVWPPLQPPTPKPQIPIITTDDEVANANKFQFQALDENARSFMAAIRPPSTCYSPPTEDKPFPSIPYYQQHLAFFEVEPEHAGVFDPKLRPRTPNRSKSPAFGPPMNPMRAGIPKTKNPLDDESGLYLCGGKLMSPIWYGSKDMPPDVKQRAQSPRPGSRTGLDTFHKPDRKLFIQQLESMQRKQLESLQTEKRTQVTQVTEKSSEEVVNVSDIPKGIVANQVRRLSGDGIRTKFGNDSFSNQSDSDRQMTEGQSSASQLTTNNGSQMQSLQIPNASSSLASASATPNVNPSTFKNDLGSVGTPGAVSKHGKTFTTAGPTRGQGVLTQPSAGGRIPICGACGTQIRWDLVVFLELCGKFNSCMSK